MNDDQQKAAEEALNQIDCHRLGIADKLTMLWTSTFIRQGQFKYAERYLQKYIELNEERAADARKILERVKALHENKQRGNHVELP